LLFTLGVPKHYGVENPFEWMDMISLQGKTNFFEKRVGDYQKAGVKLVEGDKEASKKLNFADDDF
jgi:ribonucleoside-diphosphate reductase subunit M2